MIADQTATPTTANRRAGPSRARCSVSRQSQSAHAMIAGGATWWRLFGCERPTKYVKARIAKEVEPASPTKRSLRPCTRAGRLTATKASSKADAKDTPASTKPADHGSTGRV